MEIDCTSSSDGLAGLVGVLGASAASNVPLPSASSSDQRLSVGELSPENRGGNIGDIDAGESTLSVGADRSNSGFELLGFDEAEDNEGFSGGSKFIGATCPRFSTRSLVERVVLSSNAGMAGAGGVCRFRCVGADFAVAPAINLHRAQGIKL